MPPVSGPGATGATTPDHGDELATALSRIGAVRLSFDDLFQLPHARPAPMFVDIRSTFSRSELRPLLVDGLLAAGRTIGVEAGEIDLVAGDETAGVPLAAWVAAHLGVGMVYLRKAPKDHGLPNVIEGGDVAGRRVLVVTDLVHIGDTLRQPLAVLEEQGATVLGVCALLNRAPWPAYDPWRGLGVPFRAVLQVRTLLDVGRARGDLSDDQHRRLGEYVTSLEDQDHYAAGRPPVSSARSTSAPAAADGC